MNMKDKLLSLFLELEKVHPMKGDYISFIKDTNIPLEDRWEVFCKAPQTWRMHKGSVFYTEVFPDIDWYQDFFKDRYMVIDLIDIIKEMEDSLYAPQLQINQFKEEILSHNLGSFANDW